MKVTRSRLSLRSLPLLLWSSALLQCSAFVVDETALTLDKARNKTVTIKAKSCNQFPCSLSPGYYWIVLSVDEDLPADCNLGDDISMNVDYFSWNDRCTTDQPEQFKFYSSEPNKQEDKQVSFAAKKLWFDLSDTISLYSTCSLDFEARLSVTGRSPSSDRMPEYIAPDSLGEHAMQTDCLFAASAIVFLLINVSIFVLCFLCSRAKRDGPLQQVRIVTTGSVVQMTGTAVGAELQAPRQKVVDPLTDKEAFLRI